MTPKQNQQVIIYQLKKLRIIKKYKLKLVYTWKIQAAWMDTLTSTLNSKMP